MPRPVFFCKRAALCAAAALAVRCGTDPDGGGMATMAVLDVGQGLAQMAVSAGEAVAWDMGLASENPKWLDGYEALGSPRIEAVVISHSDADHLGGLSALSLSIDFTGIVVTHPFEDTALIRETAGPRRGAISFRLLSQGDTLGGLAGVRIECLWPPRDIPCSLPLADEDKNRYSMCFLVSYGQCRALVTSDIDTFSERSLSSFYGARLKADWLVAPHHGSRTSVEPVFFGFVNPQTAVVSCGEPPNVYGHPSEEMLDLLFAMQVRVKTTYADGTVRASTNGFYWMW